MSVIHIAGLDVEVGPYLRQRCAWCGSVLVDYDLRRVAVPVGMDPKPSTWQIGSLVEVDGHISSVVEHKDGDQLPTGCCGALDPEVTA